MGIRNLIYFIMSVMTLMAVLLPQEATVSAPRALFSSRIPFARHIIGGISGNGAHSVYATDLDGDGDVDVLGAGGLSPYNGEIAWWENDGSEIFTKHSIDDHFIDASSVYANDVDGDGDVDVLGAASGDSDITWWENDGNENFTEHTIDSYFSFARSVYATDVDEDGDVDVLGAATGASDITWWENDGNENFTEHTIDSLFGGAWSVYAIDMDGDGDVDVLGAASGAGDITWWENDGSENFAEHTIDSDFNGAKSVYAIDMDGDGDLDVLGAASGDSNITWWENDGNENFTEHTIDSYFSDAWSVYATDVDDDGDMDVLAAGGDNLTWWEHDGDRNFTRHIITSGCYGAESVYATDVDGDRDIDVLGAADHSYVFIWCEQGDPLRDTFLPAVSKSAGPPSSAPVLNDISNPSGTGDYTISWSSVSGATEYILREDDNALFTSPTTVYSGASTSTTITGRDIGTYYYRVQASNSFGSSSWSNVVSVQVTQSPTPTPTPKPKTWVNVKNHCSCTVFVDFVGPDTEWVAVPANSTGVVFLTPGTYYYEIGSFGCGSASGFVTIPHVVLFNFHIYCTASLDNCPTEMGQERVNCVAIQLVR